MFEKLIEKRYWPKVSKSQFGRSLGRYDSVSIGVRSRFVLVHCISGLVK
jgi:hypothetical protein